MIETPEIAQTAAQLTAVIHVTVPRSQIRSVMGPGIREVMEAVKGQGVGPAGPWFTHHFRMSPATFDFEICVPVTAPVMAVGRVTPGHMPAQRIVRTVYNGPYEDLGAAWREFDEWIASNGCDPLPDLYECYLAGPESSPDPANWRTELSRPLIG